MKQFIITTLAMLLFIIASIAQTNEELRIEPPFWWTGMQSNSIQLLVYGQDIGNATNVVIKDSSLLLLSIEKVDNENYIFLNLQISESTEPGQYKIQYNLNTEKKEFYYTIKSRSNSEDKHQGFNASDVVYLLMPDRFANALPENDTIAGFLDNTIDRTDSLARHGGDLRGIINHLDFIADLGPTVIWLNPVLENNVDTWSYHGYAITDLYKVDPRFGSNTDYLEMVNKAHELGLKVIMDMVANHCGNNHWIVKDPPMKDWVQVFPEFTRTNYRGVTSVDPYTSQSDYQLMEKGWFDVMMPDLNQNNAFVQKYLIQNTLWWIEYSGIDGIRMDTYSYPDKDFLAEWAAIVKREYPKFNIIAEVWENRSTTQAYWQSGANANNKYDSNVSAVTDFVWKNALEKALNEEPGWDKGLSRMYYTMTEDRIYSEPNELVIFLDNHDLPRFMSSMNGDMARMKMGIAMLLTSRGTPQWYYGTELGLTGYTHGGVRSDYPGGWKGDNNNTFKHEYSDKLQKELFEYSRTVLTWRKKHPELMLGKLMHFIPANGIYVYFRYTDNEKIMVILNENDTEKTLKTKRFTEILSAHAKGTNIVTGEVLDKLGKIRVGGKSALILEISE